MIFALMAGLLLPRGTPLPSPYLPLSWRPMIPVRALDGLKPIMVIRGNYWLEGGYIRLSFVYDLGDREFNLREVSRREGFVLSGSFGQPPNNRFNRQKDGVVQTLAQLKIDAPESQGWPSVLKPGRYAMINESPMPTNLPKKWHPRDITMAPPVPPDYPPKFDYAKNGRIFQVFSDPVLILFYRPNVSVQVVVIVPRPYEEVSQQAAAEMKSAMWQRQESPGNQHFFNLKDKYGLISVTIDKYGEGTSPKACRIMFGYTYMDMTHLPRIE